MGSIFGGFKLGRSAQHLPVTVAVKKLSTELPAAFIDAFQRRVWLVYTGKQVGFHSQ